MPRHVIRPGHTSKTHGRWVEGTRDERVLLSSKYNPDGSIDQNYVAALALARRIGLVKDRADMASAADVELKFAMVMRRHDLKHATIVINHPKGPCVGPLGCDALLERFLPADAELTVHWPGNSKTYRGKGPTS